ncbi:hypothetical protein CTI12_AA071820 [Artemisia annua]|uniref:Uncharacterized protein n=1 Tax=Artemisia annua TaxID=35608 RepID=A0A2U1Q5J4_ARTAN|nr:hypothetical protein CTI12_AA071820 [Artemisia annua]
MDPERPGALVKMDEEEVAEEMWREICIEKGLPLNTPYVINNDFQSMTWRESVCDGIWREIYSRKGLLPNTFSSSSDDEDDQEKLTYDIYEHKTTDMTMMIE